MKIKNLKYHMKRLFGQKKMVDLMKLEEFADPAVELEQLYKSRLEHLVEVKQPMVLVAQIQRSGGTLMSQLFDGHHQLHAHPYELYVGYPRKWDWPEIDLSASPETWYERLYEKYTVRHFVEGYQKYGKGADADAEMFPFLMLPNLQRTIFRACVENTEIKTSRDVVDCYFTAYFNAWLDYQGIYGEKKYVTAFAPRANVSEVGVKRFFTDYPDGRIISMLREPGSWFVSSHRHDPTKYPDANSAIDQWIESTEAILRNKKNYPDNVFVLSFEQLLEDTESHMCNVADWLGVEYSEALIKPTFQGMKIKADSSFKVSGYGVASEPLKRKKNLSPEDAEIISAKAGALYEKALTLLD